MANPHPTHKWKKGDPSPNPKGAPQKQESLTWMMKEFLKKVPEGQEKSYKEIFIEKAYAKAVKEGDGPTMKMIWQYIDGMPSQNINLGNNPENPLFKIDL